MSVAASAPEAVGRLLARARSVWAPPPELTVSEFADRELQVTSGQEAGTRWRTRSYQREPMDVFDREPGVEICVWRTSAQTGKTSQALSLTAYHIKHDPCPILVVQPTIDMAKEFVVNRLDRLIEATPALREVVSKKRSNDSANTMLLKAFRGGNIGIAAAGSASQLASRPIRILILDEVDRYKAELKGEGAPISVAMKRTASFRGRRRVLIISTPTLVGAPIDVWFKRGDQRHFYVPCPACGHMHTLEWKNLRWTDRDPSTACFRCPACDKPMNDAQRNAAVERGEWRPHAQAADPTVASFHIWEAYSPAATMEDIVRGFLRARETQKAGDNTDMHAWENTTLGEPVQVRTSTGADPHELLRHVEVYGETEAGQPVRAPAGVACLTMGVDTQDDRLEALVLGWGLGEECWVVDRRRLTGDTSMPTNAGVWLALDELLFSTYQHGLGPRLPIFATCIDSAGHRTTQVYEWVLRHARHGRAVYAVIGRDGQRPIISKPSPQRWGNRPRPVDLYTVGVDSAKKLIADRLALPEPGPGYVHLPKEDWVDGDFADQLTAERHVFKGYRKGMAIFEWQLTRPGQRNEMLDCNVYGLAALRLRRADLPAMLQRIRVAAALPPAAGPQPARPQPQPRATTDAGERRVARSSYLSRR